MDGVIVLDKPAGISSAAAVNAVKRLLPRGTKIGHAGTLDPFATGLLLLLVGKYTKHCEQLMDSPKQYEATIRLGATTETDDVESPERVTPGMTSGLTTGWSPPDLENLREGLAHFVGNIEQTPPTYSAIKIAGRRACDRVRAGQTVQIKPRIVRVDQITLLHYAWPDVKVRIDCGRGTYIRSIARDLGEKLGVGGYLTQLRRTRSGSYDVEQAVDLDRLRTDGVEAHLCVSEDHGKKV